jgi:hypothetical protein
MLATTINFSFKKGEYIPEKLTIPKSAINLVNHGGHIIVSAEDTDRRHYANL